MFKKTALLIIGVVVLAGSFTASTSPQSADALSGSQFDASHIIDDTVFYDGTSMTTSEIQNFLNSKVPSCDTNGSVSKSYYYNSSTGRVNNSNDSWVTTTRKVYGQRYNAWYNTNIAATPFTCLKDYKLNTPSRNAESGICGYLPSRTGRTAAAILTDVGAACGVSPKALLVLLQKEQGLVTDTWPWTNQYQKATGYGCPDTAPCNSEYFGFFNQVYKAAWQYKKYRANPTNYNYVAGQNNKIYYNPNTACGYSWVNIRNQATAGLYNYTPYQPNQSALDNLYGSGNSCGAYGNRNFWRYFNDWFGSPTDTLFKISGGGDTVYLNWGSTYYAIPSMAVLRAYGLDKTPIKSIDASQLDVMTEGPALSILAKFGSSSTVYLIDDGAYINVPDMATFDAYGFSGMNTKVYSDTNIMSLLGSGGTLKTLTREPSGAINYVDAGKKHIFPDYNTFKTLGPSLTGDPSLQFTKLSSEFVGTITEGSPELLDGKIVKAADSPAIYLYDSGALWWFSANTWKAWGKKIDYGKLSSTGLSQIPAASGPAPFLLSDGASHYLVNQGSLYTYDNTVESAWGLSSVDFVQLSDAAISRLGTGANVGTLLRSPNGAVYMLRSNERVVVASLDDFNGLGLSWKNVQNLTENSLSVVPNSTSFAFAPKSLIRLPGGAIYWIDTDFQKHKIPSMDMFNGYGFSSKNVRSFDRNDVLDTYTNTSLERVIAGSASKYYLADRGQSLAISSALYGSSAYNFGSFPQVSLSDKLIGSLKQGPALTQYIQGSTSTVYMVENGQKHPISSPSSLFAHGGTWNSVTKVSDGFLSSIPTGSTY